MHKLLYILLILICMFTFSHVARLSGLIFPAYITLAFADEAQEMAENAPPILQAAYDGNWKKVFAMAKKDKKQLAATDDLGNTVLHEAASQGNNAAIMELLRLGANKNATDRSSMCSRPYDIAKHNKKISPNVLKMLQ